MNLKLRTTVALLILVIGITVAVRLDTGRNETQPGPASYSAAEPAVFEVSWRRGSLILAGNTVSSRHEEQLREVAATQFPGAVLHADFHPLGVAPDWWIQATTDLLPALSALQSPSATLKTDYLKVSGLVADKSAAELRLQALERSLPDSVRFDFQFEAVAKDTTPRMMCARQLATFEAGPVKFEESGTEFRSSAYLALDRVVSLADACRDSTISITGHTDSSGNETWNQQLSLDRARAVAGYLGQKGIEPGRFIVVGAGSSVPVADNATRYGRGLNRRIDIRMTPEQPE